MHSCLYQGHVQHRRLSPVEHAFRYRVYLGYLDLDELPTLLRGGYGIARWSLAMMNGAPMGDAQWKGRDPSSSYDLGTTGAPGGNVFVGNSGGTQSANVSLNTAAGVVVAAVGNAWDPGIQGADGAGNLAIGTIATGTGANYHIVAGALATGP